MQEASDALSKLQTVTLFRLPGLFSAVDDRQYRCSLFKSSLHKFYLSSFHEAYDERQQSIDKI